VSFILPVIQRDFDVTEADVQWVVASYVLVWVSMLSHSRREDAHGQGCFLLLAGRLCDVLGRKRGFLFGCSTYIMWNIVCTFMPVRLRPLSLVVSSYGWETG
jgi:MFS family permease